MFIVIVNCYIVIEPNITSMVELSKNILTKVSFDRQLFQKELEKSVRWISKSEDLQSFKEWCMIEFGHLYPSVLRKVFYKL